MNKILSIKEMDYDVFEEGVEQNYIGYRIKACYTEVNILIDAERSCCEKFGYMASEDNLEYFIGAEIISVSVVSKGNKKLVSALKSLEDDNHKFEAEFVEFKTSKGIFQIAVYNAHNGYYSHNIIISITGEL